MRDLEVAPEPSWLVFAKIARDPCLLHAFTRIFRRQQSPYTLLPVGRALRWIAGAALRGQPGLLCDFIARGRRNRRVLDEIARRWRWLAALDAPARPATRASTPRGGLGLDTA